MKIFNRIKIYIAALAIIFIITAWGIIMASKPVSDTDSPVRITIARGRSARQIASSLKDAGAIRSATMFVISCRMTGAGNQLKPGTYLVNKNMNLQQVISRLVSGETIESWVTIPEGYTIRQIADELHNRQFVDDSVFVRMALTQGFNLPKFAFIHGHNLEGYLFPDTYLFQRGVDTEYIISAMLSTFETKIVDKYRSQILSVGAEKFGYGPERFNESLYKLLIMASLVEREAQKPGDRPLIAAVLWNRLKKQMRLEVCATVSYVPGESRGNKEKIYIVDTRVDSPYNTYKNYGLPPTPICNPGLASFKAVLEPASVDYLYYVAKGDGGHIFSRTYKEHLTAKHTVRTGTK